MGPEKRNLAVCWAACFLVALIALPARADPAVWMKKTRPNELALSLSVHDDCPDHRSRYERLVWSVFDEHWIERVPLAPGEIYLRVELWCQTSITIYPFTVHADFAVVDAPYQSPRTLGPGYDTAGAGSYAEILQQTARIVRLALADHVTANFDL
ncbi:MAG: hypothetical protein ACWGPN_16715 [Gammaproteobacteria bacterium]